MTCENTMSPSAATHSATRPRIFCPLAPGRKGKGKKNGLRGTAIELGACSASSSRNVPRCRRSQGVYSPSFGQQPILLAAPHILLARLPGLHFPSWSPCTADSTKAGKWSGPSQRKESACDCCAYERRGGQSGSILGPRLHT